MSRSSTGSRRRGRSGWLVPLGVFVVVPLGPDSAADDPLLQPVTLDVDAMSAPDDVVTEALGLVRALASGRDPT